MTHIYSQRHTYTHRDRQILTPDNTLTHLHAMTHNETHIIIHTIIHTLRQTHTITNTYLHKQGHDHNDIHNDTNEWVNEISTVNIIFASDTSARATGLKRILAIYIQYLII